MEENRRDAKLYNKKANLDDDRRCTKDKINQENTFSVNKTTSMGTLILWNISKALENNPSIDLKQAIKAAQDRLEKNSRDVNGLISQQPEERHLACALLAWQQLGHQDADSLYQFYETKRILEESSSKVAMNKKDTGLRSCDSNKDLNGLKGNGFASFAPLSMGPVVKLPRQTKIVMRLENAPSTRQMPKKQKGQDKDIMDKIDAACCLETACVERLCTLDATTIDLRTRASKLARREAERMELLERAEAAWKDLELGYYRRLTLAEEKEEDMTKRVQKLIEERNGYKNACMALAQQLRLKSEAADKDRARLTQMEKEVCDRACIRQRLGEESSRGEALLADLLCKSAQLDRDLQFKEEQARRKLLSMESEEESARALTHEAERAMRAELGALREQIGQVSNQLLEEDAENIRIKQELEDLREEKMGMVEDLDGCKVTCDNRMQGKLEELKKKREQLIELKDKVMECRCKLPVDAIVEAKRTPSLAALCRCTPEDKILESCSCTSLRSRLLSNLLSDLFGGLQTEMGGSGSQMPCQLLKCLEDKHNWDRASIVKTNLRDYFAQLLIGELDIAIATSIENYHAKWVGASCADEARLIPEPGKIQNEEWQERTLECKAQKLATQLAEQLFQERAEQLTQRAKDIVTTGPPPCECKPQPALFPCLVKTPQPMSSGATTYWRQTFQDVTQLRLEIEDLKKDSIKKQDLQLMEDKIAKILQHPTGTISAELATDTIEKMKAVEESSKRENNIIKTTYTEVPRFNVTHSKPGIAKKRQLDVTVSPRKANKSSFNNNSDVDKSSKSYKKQTFAVNMCLCSAQKDSHKLNQQCKPMQNAINNEERKPWKRKSSKEIDSQVSSIRRTKPINTQHLNTECNNISNSKTSTQHSCRSNCICFHKLPSNTSIDKLLETLVKWKCDMSDSKYKEESEKNIISGNAIFRDNNEMKDNSMRETKHSEVSKIDSNKNGGVDDSKVCLMSCNEIDRNIKSMDCEHAVPTTTESEYMGAVNLDKSNENICKCIQNNNKNIVKDNQDNNGTPKFVYKCIHSSDCVCETNIGMKNEISAIQPQLQIQPQNKNNLDTSTIQNRAKVISILENTSKNPNICQKIDKEKSIIDTKENEKSELCPSDYDYHIKFLGVTLVNTDFAKKGISVKDSSSNIVDNLCYNENKTNQEKRHMHIEQGNIDNMDISKSSNCGFDNESCKSDNCIIDKYDKLIKSANEQIKKVSLKENKADETVLKLRESKVKVESCVCCNSLCVDESKDLEVNAFHLLEQHLRGQLEEFKSASCKSSCISNEEEQKILTTILHKVRQVISDSTKQMTCKCSGQQRIEGSWKRAYGLLQEYLRTKMKRVQCLCVSKENVNCPSPKLDNVLEKVCRLIENDFERLKNICNCKPTILDCTEETPVKDTDHLVLFDLKTNKRVDTSVHDAICSNREKVSKQNSNKSIILTQNISSQVAPNLGMETKSCAAMERGTKNVQTVETKSTMHYKSTNFDILDCNSSGKLTTQNNVTVLGTNEIFINCCTDLSKKEDVYNYIKLSTYKPCNCSELPKDVISGLNQDIEAKLSIDKNLEKIEDNLQKETTNSKTTKHPYIGYTFNCCCDSKLGSCVCMKSNVQKNNDTINEIWKRYTENNSACVPNLSYIMNPIQHRINTPINMIECDNVLVMTHTGNDYAESIDNRNVCEVEISVRDEEDMVLKESRQTCDGINNTTNTFDENASVGTNYSNTEDPIDWYECGSQLHNHHDDLVDDKFENSIYTPVPMRRYQRHIKEEIFSDVKTAKLSNLRIPNCDCNMVPICHVKLLVENIEDKLVNFQCTCDSLLAKACPIHSTNFS